MVSNVEQFYYQINVNIIQQIIMLKNKFCWSHTETNLIKTFLDKLRFRTFYTQQSQYNQFV